MSDDEARPAAGRGGPSVNESECLCLNHEIVDMLTLLNYESEFCDKELPPIPIFFFVYAPTSQDGKQFKYFHCLVSWLLGLLRVDASWKKFDAPQQICQTMGRALKEVGVSSDASASRLKAGYGDGICQVLHELCTKVLEKTNWQWNGPEWPDEPLCDEADVDSDAELNAIDEEVPAGMPDDDEEVFAEIVDKAEGGKTAHDEDTWFVANTVDPREWQLELERVTPQLRVQLSNDTNEWRVHVQQTQQYKDHMSKTLPAANNQLQALGSDLSQILQRVKDKEDYINRHFEQRATEYKTRQRDLEEVTQRYNLLNESHLQKMEDLRLATEEFDQLKAEMSDRSQTVQDTAPLVKIKDAVKKLKNDIRQMDLRIGVVNHTLMQAKLRQHPAQGKGEGAKGYMDVDDD